MHAESLVWFTNGPGNSYYRSNHQPVERAQTFSPENLCVNDDNLPKRSFSHKKEEALAIGESCLEECNKRKQRISSHYLGLSDTS